jgi:two-component system chemotaxis response regulator CheB
MPRSAIGTGAVDHVAPLRDIALLLAALSEEESPPPVTASGRAAATDGPDLGEMPLAVRGADRPCHRSVFTCPPCRGTLWEAEDGRVLRFRCRVGHVYSSDSMQTDEVDRALSVALRTLEKCAPLAYRLADSSSFIV